MLLGDAIRAAVRNDPRTMKEIFTACHVPKSTFLRFMADDRNVGNSSLETVQRIAAEVGLTFRPLVECDRCLWDKHRVDLRKWVKQKP